MYNVVDKHLQIR